MSTVTDVLAPFPDAERMVLDVVASLGTTGSETPLQLQSSLPYIRAHRTGGIDDRVSDSADIEVSVFAADLSVAKAAAEQVRQILTAGPHRTAHGQIDYARTAAGPAALPATDSASLRQVTASYEVRARR